MSNETQKPEITAARGTDEWYEQINAIRAWEKAQEDQAKLEAINNHSLMVCWTAVMNSVLSRKQAEHAKRAAEKIEATAKQEYADALAQHLKIRELCLLLPCPQNFLTFPLDILEGINYLIDIGRS